MYIHACGLHTYTEAYELSKASKEFDTSFRDNPDYITTFEIIDVICGCYIYILLPFKQICFDGDVTLELA